MALRFVPSIYVSSYAWLVMFSLQTSCGIYHIRTPFHGNISSCVQTGNTVVSTCNHIYCIGRASHQSALGYVSLRLVCLHLHNHTDHNGTVSGQYVASCGFSVYRVHCIYSCIDRNDVSFPSGVLSSYAYLRQPLSSSCIHIDHSGVSSRLYAYPNEVSDGMTG